ncbi:hypothetical protein LI003_22885, partial [Bacteroides caccae]|uniref:hypothetical protein n=1 Tax=Bacteroides caccae TaxID=47678 RepID=UPI001D094BED
AAYLATKYGENDMVVDILIEDSKKYAEAVEYCWRLEPQLVCTCRHHASWYTNRYKAYHNLMKYARVLLANCPEQTTKLFIIYYTGKYKP